MSATSTTTTETATNNTVVCDTTTTTSRPIYLYTSAGKYRLNFEYCGEDDGVNQDFKDLEILEHEMDNGEFENDTNIYGNKRYQSEKLTNNLSYYVDTLDDLQESFENYITCLEIRQKLKKQRIEIIEENLIKMK